MSKTQKHLADLGNSLQVIGSVLESGLDDAEATADARAALQHAVLHLREAQVSTATLELELTGLIAMEALARVRQRLLQRLSAPGGDTVGNLAAALREAGITRLSVMLDAGSWTATATTREGDSRDGNACDLYSALLEAINRVIAMRETAALATRNVL